MFALGGYWLDQVRMQQSEDRGKHKCKKRCEMEAKEMMQGPATSYEQNCTAHRQENTTAHLQFISLISRKDRDAKWA